MQLIIVSTDFGKKLSSLRKYFLLVFSRNLSLIVGYVNQLTCFNQLRKQPKGLRLRRVISIVFQHLMLNLRGRENVFKVIQ